MRLNRWLRALKGFDIQLHDTTHDTKGNDSTKEMKSVLSED